MGSKVRDEYNIKDIVISDEMALIDSIAKFAPNINNKDITNND